MNKKTSALLFGVGTAFGFLVTQQLIKRQKTSPELALNQAKETFKKQGPISGSWIYMKPEEVEKNGLLYTAYRGGVTRNIDGESKQYEFYADADTGTIVSTNPANK